MAKAVKVAPATVAQYHRAKALGYSGSCSSLYSFDMAERTIAKLEAKKSAREASFKPAWDKGEALLSSGYTITPMYGEGREFCYTVEGGTETYHVCLDPQSTGYGCSCPDGIQRGDKRPCKHQLGTMVQVWQWAQDATQGHRDAQEAHQDAQEDYSEYLSLCGITRIRAAHEARQILASESGQATDSDASVTDATGIDDRGECGDLDADTLARCDGRRRVTYETFAGQIGFPVWTCDKCGKREVK